MIEWNGFPVSTNNRAFIENGLFKLTKEYCFFKRGIENACCNNSKVFSGYVDLYLKMWLSPNKDTDNYIKGICDGIKDAGIIIDDKYIKNITIERFYITSSYSKIQIELKEKKKKKITTEQKRVIQIYNRTPIK